MKRVVAAAMALLLSVFASACGQESRGDMTKVYFMQLPVAGQNLKGYVYEMRNIEEQDISKKCAAIIEAMKIPDEKANMSLIPEGMKINSIKVAGDIAFLDLSYHYKEMGSLERVQTSASIAKSFFATEEINYLSITCDGEGQPPMYDEYYTRENVITDYAGIMGTENWGDAE